MTAGITYDTGALIAAERNDRQLWALHRRALERGQVPTVPAGVLAQGWRGGPQAQLSRLLAGCRIESLDEVRARSAGAACRVARSSDVVDASVVVGAAARDDLVVTSDPDDIARLGDALRIAMGIHVV
ncbi:MAG: twitching motility protein PilT [Actinobacteria bacterium]|nr:twitching motility protein PilT [Actinomycetota bacterium]